MTEIPQFFPHTLMNFIGCHQQLNSSLIINLILPHGYFCLVKYVSGRSFPLRIHLPNPPESIMETYSQHHLPLILLHLIFIPIIFTACGASPLSTFRAYVADPDAVADDVHRLIST